MQLLIVFLSLLALSCIILVTLSDRKCPHCGGKLKEFTYDGEVDKIIYKCTKCGEKFV